MLADGNPVLASQIYYETTIADAILCARHLIKKKREEEYHRQCLYSIINRSLGGSFMPDTSLLDMPLGLRKTNYKKNWLKLAKKMGIKLPKNVEEKLKHG